jgi:hypothetical protein
MLVHKANRGGLLASPHNCHRNAENIRAAGADLSQLTNSYCVELDDGPLKQQHVEKNVALHARANGLISAVTGAERYMLPLAVDIPAGSAIMHMQVGRHRVPNSRWQGAIESAFNICALLQFLQRWYIGVESCENSCGQEVS